jgi:hypothetical protein
LGGRLPCSPPGAAGDAAVALEPDRETEAALRLMRACVEAQETMFRRPGIAQLSVGEDAHKLAQMADAKLYEAKCTGRNRVIAAYPRRWPACRVPLRPRSG